MRCEGDEAGAADGRYLCRHPVAVGAARLVAPRPARQSAGLAEAMVGVSPRRGVAPHALEQCTCDGPVGVPWRPHGPPMGRAPDEAGTRLPTRGGMLDCTIMTPPADFPPARAG